MRRVAEVEAATRALLILATEGDTKVGAGQSAKRDLCRQVVNDLQSDHLQLGQKVTEVGPHWPPFSSMATRRDAWDLLMKDVRGHPTRVPQPTSQAIL